MRAKNRVEAIAAFFRPRTAGPAAERATFLVARERFAAAQALVGAFYAVLLFFALSQLFSWQEFLGATNLTPRWPVFWLRYVETRTGIALILWFHLLGGLAAVALSRYRLVRVLVFLSVLEFLAFRYSFGSINHGDHLGLLLSFVLIFLPPGWSSTAAPARSTRAATLLVFSGCQALIMLTYSMSGMWKVGGVVQQALRGEVTYLSPSGLARQVAAKLLSDDSTSLLGPWLVEHYWVGWPLMIGALYLEALRAVGGDPPVAPSSLGPGAHPPARLHPPDDGGRVPPEPALARPVPRPLAVPPATPVLAPGPSRPAARRAVGGTGRKRENLVSLDRSPSASAGDGGIAAGTAFP